MSFHHTAARRALAALCVSVLIGALPACSTGENSEAAGPRDRASSTGEPVPALNVRTRVTRVLGTLSNARRRTFEAHAERVIAGYVSAAYLHERSGTAYRGSFPGFTRGARKLAMRDTGVVSDRGFAEADEVRPRGAVAYLSVVAPKGHPVGATARVWLDLVVSEDDRPRRVSVNGRLLLTPEKDHWRIFGYDLALGSSAAMGTR